MPEKLKLEECICPDASHISEPFNIVTVVCSQRDFIGQTAV